MFKKLTIIFVVLLGIVYASAVEVHLPNEFQCDLPDCTLTHGYLRLWPNKNSFYFYQCIPFFAPVVHRCAPGTRFGYSKQTCVHERDFDLIADNCGATLPVDTFRCRLPDCEFTDDAHIYRWPHINRRFFYTCTANGPQENECNESGQVFGYRAQKCIDLSEFDATLDHCSSSAMPPVGPWRRVHP